MSMMLNYCSFARLIKSRSNQLPTIAFEIVPVKKHCMKFDKNVLFQCEKSVFS